MAVTLKNIAELAGVSIRTVSLAVQGTGRMSAATRERILSIAKELGYRPNVMARGLVRSRTYLVGAVFPYIGVSFFGQIIGGIEAGCGEAGYDVLLADSSLASHSSGPDDFGNEGRALLRMIDRRVDGVIAFPHPQHFSRYQELEAAGIKLVHVMRRVPGLVAPSVTVDNVEGGRLATSRLLELGHRSIGFIGSADPFFIENAERREGFMRAHLERGLALNVDEREERCNTSSPESGKAAMKRLLTKDPSLSAVFAATDYAAIGAISALHEEGIRVPEDFSVIGYDDLELAACQTGPGLSTVAQPKGEIGKEAFKLMIALIEGSTPLPVVLRPKLVERGTSAPCRA